MKKVWGSLSNYVPWIRYDQVADANEWRLVEHVYEKVHDQG